MPYCFKNKFAGLFLLTLEAIFFPKAASSNQFQLTPSVALQQEYNDNIFFREKNKIDDYITTITGELELSDKTERHEIDLNGRLDGIAYADNDDLNAQDQFYNGSFRYRLSSRFNLLNEAGYSKDSRPDRDLETTGLILSDVTREKKYFNFSANYIITEKTASSLSYAFNKEDFDDDEFSDIRYHSFNLGLTHNISRIIPETVTSLNIGHTRYDFSGSDIKNYSFFIGASRQLSEIFSFGLTAGARYTESDFEATRLVPLNLFFYRIETIDKEKDGWGTVGELRLSYTGETTNSSFSISQDLQPASGRRGTAERTTFLFEISRNFTDKLRANMTAKYFLNDSDREEFTARGIDERTFRIHSKIRYDFTLNIALEAAYTFTTEKDNERINRDADRNLVLIRIIGHYPLFE